MSEPDATALARENAYLKLRVAQLEGDVGDLSAQVHRLTQQLERTVSRRGLVDPNRSDS